MSFNHYLETNTSIDSLAEKDLIYLVWTMPPDSGFSNCQHSSIVYANNKKPSLKTKSKTGPSSTHYAAPSISTLPKNMVHNVPKN